MQKTNSQAKSKYPSSSSEEEEDPELIPPKESKIKREAPPPQATDAEATRKEKKRLSDQKSQQKRRARLRERALTEDHPDVRPDRGKNLTKQEAKKLFETDIECRKWFFRDLLQRETTTRVGWCWLTSIVPTKENGQIQLSFYGHKFATLAKMAAYHYYNRWPVDSDNPAVAEQSSHRCNHSNCFRPGCLFYEPAKQNNARKNCLVWVACPHAEQDGCKKVVFTCTHEPPCLLYKPGIASPEQLLRAHVHPTAQVVAAASEEQKRDSASQVDA